MLSRIRLLLGSLCMALVLLGPGVVQGAEVSLVPEELNTCASWQAKYFEDERGYNESAVVERWDPVLDFDWGAGAPAPGMVEDHFSAWWQCSVYFQAGTYRFRVTSDDGMRVHVDGRLVIDAWFDHPARTFSGEISLGEGKHLVSVTYYENTGLAVARLDWAPAEVPMDGWHGHYYDNRFLRGPAVLTRTDAAIDFDWGRESWGPGGPIDNYSMRWARSLEVNAGTYRLVATSDDGVRVYLDGDLVIDEWHDHPPRTYRADVKLSGGPHEIVVEYYEHTGVARIAFSMTQIEAPAGSWKAEYYDNRWLGGAPVMTRYDRAIDFDWGYGSPPGLPRDNFSVSWQRTVDFEPGSYRFTTTTDDGVRLWVGDKLVIDQWRDQPARSHAGALYLSGQARVRMEMYEHGGVAMARLGWVRLQDGQSGVVVVDDGDPGFVKGGSGSAWRHPTGGRGGRFYWTWNNDRVRTNYNWARWYPDVGPGRYEVLVYVPAGSVRTTKARYWVSHQGGYTLRRVNQAAKSGQWVSLGTYSFAGTRKDYVSLADVTYEPYLSRSVAFDAVKWVSR